MAISDRNYNVDLDRYISRATRNPPSHLDWQTWRKVGPPGQYLAPPGGGSLFRGVPGSGARPNYGPTASHWNEFSGVSGDVASNLIQMGTQNLNDRIGSDGNSGKSGRMARRSARSAANASNPNAPAGGSGRSQYSSITAPAPSRGMKRGRGGSFDQMTQNFGVNMVQGNDFYGDNYGTVGGISIGGDANTYGGGTFSGGAPSGAGFPPPSGNPPAPPTGGFPPPSGNPTPPPAGGAGRPPKRPRVNVGTPQAGGAPPAGGTPQAGAPTPAPAPPLPVQTQVTGTPSLGAGPQPLGAVPQQSGQPPYTGQGPSSYGNTPNSTYGTSSKTFEDDLWIPPTSITGTTTPNLSSRRRTAFESMLYGQGRTQGEQDIGFRGLGLQGPLLSEVGTGPKAPAPALLQPVQGPVNPASARAKQQPQTLLNKVPRITGMGGYGPRLKTLVPGIPQGQAMPGTTMLKTKSGGVGRKSYGPAYPQ